MKYPDDYNVSCDIPYASTDNPRQYLDIATPKHKSAKPLPVIVYIHGGGWWAGCKEDKFDGHLLDFLDGSTIGVSINYRLTDEAIWPAQIHDCKAAIRWVRGNAEKYNIDPDKICVWGTSAGGHLVSMLGVSSGNDVMEGTLGSCLDQTSEVSCVIDFCGPSMVTHTVLEEYNDDVLGNPLVKLFGCKPSEDLAAANSASPVNYVSGGEPPFLIAHGEFDDIVEYNQSAWLDQL